jgi:putative addiction module component (TIGR02574 family)
MTVDEIVKESRTLSFGERNELLDRLTQEFDEPKVDPSIETAWKDEVRRRLAAIEAGEPVEDGEAVLANVRRIVGR